MISQEESFLVNNEIQFRVMLNKFKGDLIFEK